MATRCVCDTVHCVVSVVDFVVSVVRLQRAQTHIHPHAQDAHARSVAREDTAQETHRRPTTHAAVRPSISPLSLPFLSPFLPFLSPSLGGQVWDVSWSSEGFYLASASYDLTARLWSMNNHYPLRIFVGHQGDVDCVKFHPNCKYGTNDK